MDDANDDIGDVLVLVGDGVLGEVGERRATEEACDEHLEAHPGMPLHGHHDGICFAIFGGRAFVLHNKPVEHFAEFGRVGVFQPN